MKISNYLSKTIKWNATGDAEYPYSAILEGKGLRIRLNDFPSENLYTLIVSDAEFDFDDWPSSWARKPAKKASNSNAIPTGRLVRAI